MGKFMFQIGKTVLAAGLALLVMACGGGSGGGSTGSPSPVTAAPVFTLNPSDLAVQVGTSASFSVSASGTPTPTYQWERSADGVTWTAIPGATLTGYTFTTQASDQQARFRARAANSAGSATSSLATLTVSPTAPKPTITSFTATPSTVATGSSSTLAWVVSGATSLSISPTVGTVTGTSVAVTPSITTTYILTATNTAGSSTANAMVTLSRGGTAVAPAFTTQPANLTVLVGATATFVATASGTPTPTYQWERSADGVTWAPITGATQVSYGFTAQATDHAARFRAKASNSAGNATSNPAALTVNSGISIDPKRRIAAGDYHSVWVRPDGTVWVWGKDNARTAPTQVAGLTGQYVAVAAGASHSLVLKSDGTVWAWGGNSDGQLGDGTTVDRPMPILVTGLNEKIVAIAAGANHSLALTESGTVWAWGENGLGQLGDGTTVVRYTPVIVQNISGIRDVAGSRENSYALRSDGTVWQWGWVTFISKRPTQVGSLNSIVSVSAGTYHAMALKSDGTLLAWGSNSWGQLGDDTGKPSDTPVIVKSSSAFTAMAAGSTFSLGLKADGSLHAWGDNKSGQLGEGTIQDRYSPWPVMGMGKDVVAIAAGIGHCLAIKTDGTIWAWGDNSSCQLGDGTWLTSRHEPVRVAGMEGQAAMVVGGNSHGLSLGVDGLVWAWGANSTGQLGDATLSDRRAPIPVDGIQGASIVAAAGDHSLALKSDGSMIWAWGSNASGQLGDGSTTNRSRPVQVPVMVGKVVALAAGTSHSLAVKEDGTVWAWGSNAKGQLGDGSTTDSLQPIQVAGLAGKVVSVAAGVAHSLALKEDGTVWAWGLNFEGELGNGTTTNCSKPVQVVGLVGITKVVAGHFHNLALNSDGILYGWGDNAYGQVGDGSNRNDRITPVRVASLSDIQDIAAGEFHSLALKRDGTVWGWGANQYKQLSHAPLESSIPTLLSINGAKSLTAGQTFSLVIKTDGTIWAWGYGLYGQLGDGTKVSTLSAEPVRVSSRVTGVGP